MKSCLLVPALATLCLGCPAPSPAADTPDGIRGAMQSLVDQKIIAGAVTLVTDRDKTLSVEAVGYASLKTKEPMQADRLFWIASMTKSMTGVALMMLVDEGKVSLADPVEEYLPEFRGQLVAGEGDKPAHPPQHPITVREVMNHTSGLMLASDPALRNLYSIQERTAVYAKTPLLREPGTKYEYNNSGITTGGRIIEVVSGQPYAQFMQQRLFTPLGMKDTTFWPSEEQAARLARTVKRGDDKESLEEIQQDRGLTPALMEKLGPGVKVPAPILADMGGGRIPIYAHKFADPAGGLYSTAADIGAFCRAWLPGGIRRGHRLLTDEAIATMSSNQTGDVPVNPQEAYGVGWSVKIREDEGPSVGSFGHRGARRTAMWIDPTNGLGMVVLVERFDMTGDEQKLMYGSFMKVAVKAFGQAAGK